MARKLKIPRPPRPALTAEDVKVGHWYRGKNPAKAGFYQEVNDRKVIYISPSGWIVQYDSSAVADGKHYPKVTMEAFLKWASHEVFDGDPDAKKAEGQEPAQP